MDGAPEHSSHFALAEGGLEDGGCGNLVEGEVFGGAAGALLPGEEEPAVAVGEAGGGIDAERSESAIDPGRRAFQLGIVADGCLVDYEMARR